MKWAINNLWPYCASRKILIQIDIANNFFSPCDNEGRRGTKRVASVNNYYSMSHMDSLENFEKKKLSK